MSAAVKVRIFGAVLALWFVATAVVYVVLWNSPTFKWGNHPPLLFNSLGLCFTYGVYGLYRYKQSIAFALHGVLSLLLYGGAYMTITTGAMGVLKHDYASLGQRYVIMASILVPGACIDLWYRIKYHRWTSV